MGCDILRRVWLPPSYKVYGTAHLVLASMVRPWLALEHSLERPTVIFPLLPFVLLQSRITAPKNKLVFCIYVQQFLLWTLPFYLCVLPEQMNTTCTYTSYAYVPGIRHCSVRKYKLGFGLWGEHVIANVARTLHIWLETENQANKSREIKSNTPVIHSLGPKK